MAACCTAPVCQEKEAASSSGESSPNGREVPPKSEELRKTKFIGSSTTDIRHVVFRVQGMDCAGCATSVDNLVRVIPGVVRHDTNFAVSQLQISFNSAMTDEKKIQKTLNAAGYDSTVANNSQKELLQSLTRVEDSNQFRRRFFESLLFSIPLFLITDLIPHFFPESVLNKLLRPGLYLGDVLAIILTFPIFWCARRFLLSTWAALRSWTTNLDVLITVSISSASAYSIFVVLLAVVRAQSTRPETFFETTGELLSFILFGRWLESTCSGWTAGTLSGLVRLAPKKATRIISGLESEVPVELLAVGDQLMNRPGSQFAADGVILTGSSDVDESMLTGDLIPVYRQPGDKVVAGSYNLNGTVRIEVQAIGTDTQLSQVVELMKDAQGNKAELQLLADKIASYFIFFIMILAMATFVAWLRLDPTRFLHKGLSYQDIPRTMLSLKLAIAVIVISCPCALSVATPAAVMCGIGVGSKEGILIKGAKVFETLNKVTDFVFDKTGTLTNGKMIISNIHLEPRYVDQERLIWQAITTCEEMLGHAHPISDALVHYGNRFEKDNSLEVRSFEDVPGKGLLCVIGSETSLPSPLTLVLGNKRLLADHSIAIPDYQNAQVHTTGKTQVHFSIDGASYAGFILLADQIKVDAKQTMMALQKLGKTTWMLTGDDGSVAAKVAACIGIPAAQVFSEQTVTDKVSVIADLQRQGKRVAMIGDGINDAPALALADVGFSLTGSTAIALECADVILMRPRVLIDVATAYVLSRDVFTRIKYNLVFAFAWNLIGIPFAMGVLLPVGIYLPPVLAGALMSISCVCIICSSLLLRLWRRSSSLGLPSEQELIDNTLCKRLHRLFREKKKISSSQVGV